MEQLERLGVQVVTNNQTPTDVVHIHWQDKLLHSKSEPGVKYVWTCHNLHPHGTADDDKLAAFLSRIDEVIVHNRYSQLYLQQRFNRESSCIPHGHFMDAYPNEMNRSKARKLLGIAADKQVLLHFGAIKPYKNVPRLMLQFTELPGADWMLLVVGYVHRVDLSRLKALAEADPRIRLINGFVQPEEVQVYMNAADALVLAYDSITTSGSAILGMSFDLPVIAPNLPPVRELVKAGAFYNNHLAEALEAWHLLGAGNQDYIQQYNWDNIANETKQVYERCL